jgi:hypothetical protein
MCRGDADAKDAAGLGGRRRKLSWMEEEESPPRDVGLKKRVAGWQTSFDPSDGFSRVVHRKRRLVSRSGGGAREMGDVAIVNRRTAAKKKMKSKMVVMEEGEREFEGFRCW